MKSVKNLFLGTLLTALVFTGCDQGLGVSGGGLPALTGAAAISGTLRVEETLTAETTLNVPVGIENLYHYQWQRKAADEDAAWTNIDEAVSAGYTLAPDDEGKYIQVLVTVTGYGGAVTGSREETVAQGGGGGNGNGNGNGEDQGGSLTADVSYVPTNDETDWDEGAWTGKGTAEEAWGLAVTETPVVYFSVQKTATQTITVGGTDEDLVEMAETGQTWDEATASDTLAVFKVKANKVRNGKFPGGAARESDGKTEADVYDEWYDSTFEGDNFQFTLNVSEPGKDGKTVTVNLEQKVNLSTAAVFIVKENHTLERQTGIKRFADISNAGMNSHKVNFDDSPGTRLIDMLVWVDQNLDNNTEYLVRVVANEEMWPVYITYTREGGVSYPSGATGKVRLRGAGSTPSVIKPITGVEANKNAYRYFKYYGQNDGRSLTSTAMNEGFITLYHGGMLQLEKNITITGNGDNKFPCQLIYMRYAHLVMKEGAALRDFNATVSSSSGTAVGLYSPDNDKPAGRFTMEGGSIANTVGVCAPIFSSKSPTYFPGVFVKTGGVLTNNKNKADNKTNHMFYSNSNGSTSVEITGNGSYPPIPKK